MLGQQPPSANNDFGDSLEPDIHEAWATRVRTLLHPAIRQQIQNPHYSVVVRNPKHQNKLELSSNFEPPLQAAQRRFAQRQVMLMKESEETNKLRLQPSSNNNKMLLNVAKQQFHYSPASTVQLQTNSKKNISEEQEDALSPSSFHRHQQNESLQQRNLEMLQKQQKMSLIGAWNSEATKNIEMKRRKEDRNEQLQPQQSLESLASVSPTPVFPPHRQSNQNQQQFQHASSPSNVLVLSLTDSGQDGRRGVSPKPVKHPLSHSNNNLTKISSYSNNNNVGEISPLTENSVASPPLGEFINNKKNSSTPRPTQKNGDSPSFTSTPQHKNKSRLHQQQQQQQQPFLSAEVAKMGRQVHQHIRDIIETDGPNPSPRRTNIALDQISTLLELVANGGHSLSRTPDDDASPPMPNETPERIAATSLRRTERNYDDGGKWEQGVGSQPAPGKMTVITTKVTKKTTRNVDVVPANREREENEGNDGKIAKPSSSSASSSVLLAKSSASSAVGNNAKKERPQWIAASSSPKNKKMVASVADETASYSSPTSRGKLLKEQQAKNALLEESLKKKKGSRIIETNNKKSHNSRPSSTGSHNSNARLPRVNSDVEKDRLQRAHKNEINNNSSSMMLQHLADSNEEDEDDQHHNEEKDEGNDEEEGQMRIRQDQQQSHHPVRPYTEEEIEWLRKYAADYPVEYSAWYYQTFGVPATYSKNNLKGFHQHDDMTTNRLQTKNNNNNNDRVDDDCHEKEFVTYTPAHMAGSGLKFKVRNDNSATALFLRNNHNNRHMMGEEDDDERYDGHARHNNHIEERHSRSNSNVTSLSNSYRPFDFDRYEKEEGDMFNPRQVQRRVQQTFGRRANNNNNVHHHDPTETDEEEQQQIKKRSSSSQANANYSKNDKQRKPDVPTVARGTVLKAGTRQHQFSASSSSIRSNSIASSSSSTRPQNKHHQHQQENAKTDLYRSSSASNLAQGLKTVHENLSSKYGTENISNNEKNKNNMNSNNINSSYPPLPNSREYPQQYNFNIITRQRKETDGPNDSNVMVSRNNTNNHYSHQPKNIGHDGGGGHRRTASEIALDLLHQEEEFRHESVNEKLRSISGGAAAEFSNNNTKNHDHGNFEEGRRNKKGSRSKTDSPAYCTHF